MNIDSAERRQGLLDHYQSNRSKILTIDRIRIGYEKKTGEGNPL